MHVNRAIRILCNCIFWGTNLLLKSLFLHFFARPVNFNEKCEGGGRNVMNHYTKENSPHQPLPHPYIIPHQPLPTPAPLIIPCSYYLLSLLHLWGGIIARSCYTKGTLPTNPSPTSTPLYHTPATLPHSCTPYHAL